MPGVQGVPRGQCRVCSGDDAGDGSPRPVRHGMGRGAFRPGSHAPYRRRAVRPVGPHRARRAPVLGVPLGGRPGPGPLRPRPSGDGRRPPRARRGVRLGPGGDCRREGGRAHGDRGRHRRERPGGDHPERRRQRRARRSRRGPWTWPRPTRATRRSSSPPTSSTSATWPRWRSASSGPRGAAGATVLAADPSRAFVPRAELTALTTYEVPVLAVLEDTPVKLVTIYQLR